MSDLVTSSTPGETARILHMHVTAVHDHTLDDGETQAAAEGSE